VRVEDLAHPPFAGKGRGLVGKPRFLHEEGERQGGNGFCPQTRRPCLGGIRGAGKTTRPGTIWKSRVLPPSSVKQAEILPTINWGFFLRRANYKPRERAMGGR